MIDNDAAMTSWHREPTLPFQRMDEETIVVDPRTREVHLLNETAARIWDLLEEPASLDQLCEELAEEYEGATPEALRGEVEGFLKDLGGKGLLVARGRA
ncbi:MAG TPA: HPr-rel-A system PqqD family peptide chaperone [Polyangia bacterium]|nr:HPr-rel-A system PqqD family peptide chaperone [Polyangia bacterium]